MKELTLEITNHCSMNCIHCSTKATERGSSYIKEDMLKEYLKKFKEYDTVRLSGGEPFDHCHIDKICQTIHNQGKKVNILSCGVYIGYHGDSLPFRFLEEIQPHVNEIIFSYHGQEKLHNKITGSWKQTGKYSFWDMLCDSVNSTSRAKIPYSFETVLMKENLLKMDEIAKNMSAFGVGKFLNGSEDERMHWHILRFVKQGRGKTHQYQAPSKEDIIKFPGMVEKFRKNYSNLDITYTNSFEQKECDCGSKKAVITCHGEIIPCSALKYGAKKGKFACLERV